MAGTRRSASYARAQPSEHALLASQQLSEGETSLEYQPYASRVFAKGRMGTMCCTMSVTGNTSRLPVPIYAAK